MTDEDANLIEVDFRTDGEPAIRRRSKPAPCRHEIFEIDYDSRRVYCGSCKEEIDPFNALARIEEDWSRHAATNKLRKAEAKRLEGEIDDIKRRKRNAKAALRRLERGEGIEEKRAKIEEAARKGLTQTIAMSKDLSRRMIDRYASQIATFAVKIFTDPLKK